MLIKKITVTSGDLLHIINMMKMYYRHWLDSKYNTNIFHSKSTGSTCCVSDILAPWLASLTCDVTKSSRYNQVSTELEGDHRKDFLYSPSDGGPFKPRNLRTIKPWVELLRWGGGGSVYSNEPTCDRGGGVKSERLGESRFLICSISYFTACCLADTRMTCTLRYYSVVFKVLPL